jgi:hypothetical protein
MTWAGPTHRWVEGERINGVWCHVWVRGYSGFFVRDLFVFADGSIRCEGSFDLEGLRRRLESGAISLHNPDQPVHEPAEQRPRWLARHPEPLTHEGFLGEVRDAIEALNGRPQTSDLCWEAIRRYQQDPTEDNRLLLRSAYLAIPPHLRVYVLGDMDLHDIPLRKLTTNPGERVGGDGPIATAELYQEALEYFNSGDQELEQSRELYATLHADDPVSITAPTVTLNERVNPPVAVPDKLDLGVLRNEFPSPLSRAVPSGPERS